MYLSLFFPYSIIPFKRLFVYIKEKGATPLISLFCRPFLLVDQEAKFLKLLIFNPVRRVVHRGRCRCSLREGYYFLNGALACKDHAESVHSRSDSSMWWWRELEGVKQEAELLLGHIIWNVADSEYSLLQFDVVDSYGA